MTKRRATAFLAVVLAGPPAWAAAPDPLRLSCRLGDAAYAFSIDLPAREAVETLSGRRLAVEEFGDHIVLGEGGQVLFRIDRITGAIVLDRQLRQQGMCEKVGRKF